MKPPNTLQRRIDERLVEPQHHRYLPRGRPVILVRTTRRPRTVGVVPAVRKAGALIVLPDNAIDGDDESVADWEGLARSERGGHHPREKVMTATVGIDGG